MGSGNLYSAALQMRFLLLLCFKILEETQVEIEVYEEEAETQLSEVENGRYTEGKEEEIRMDEETNGIAEAILLLCCRTQRYTFFLSTPTIFLLNILSETV